MNIANLRFDFKLIEENLNQINFTAKSPLRDYSTYKDFLNQAILVKNRSVFEDVSIPNYVHFIPFHYQVNSVKTMLEKFEGKGVFGDQVGLGKTIQALMTADIMFRYGRIKNAVIVAPKTLILQWKGEINTKFEGVFNVLSRPGQNVDTMENLTLLDNSALLSDTQLNVVFIDSDQFQNEKTARSDKAIQEEIATKKLAITTLQSKLRLLDEEYQKLLVRYSGDINFARFTGKTREQAEMSVKEIATNRQTYATSCETIEKYKEAIKKSAESRIYAKQVDLLIIDEAHKAIDRINESAFRDIFASFSKTYCILLSATPIEKSLNDIYDLIGFVAGNRFQSIEQFYNYVEARTLSELANNKTSMERLNGLINSLFTRKRLRDSSVISALTRGEDHPLNQLTDFLDGKIETIPECKDMNGDEIEDARQRINDGIHALSKPIRELYMGGADAKIAYKNYFDFHMEALLNTYLIAYYQKSNDRFVYPYINWAPASRKPEFHSRVMPNKINDVIMEQDFVARGTARYTRMLIYRSNFTFRHELFERLSKADPKRKVLIDISLPQTERMLNLPNFLQHFSQMVVKMHLDEESAEVLLKEAAHFVNKVDSDSVREFNRYYRDFMLRQFHEDENGNAIFLIDYLRLTGADLHAASNLILCQTYVKAVGKDEPETIGPLDLEQFIGRIYRIGQSFDVTIHVFTSSEKDDYLFQKIYNDPQGLDLYGEERIETGFVIPIIVEAMKQSISSYLLRGNSNFMDIYNFCYQHHEQPYMDRFTEKIREVCSAFTIKTEEE